MLEVGLFTGFEPIDTQLRELKHNAMYNIGRYEKHNRAIHFYMDSVHSGRDTCLSFDVRQKQKVGKTQPVAVTMYDLNEPSARCTKFYHPHLNSDLLGIICQKGDCRCRD
jgi:integrin beta 2